MLTLWLAENQDGYVYTKDTIDFVNDDAAHIVAVLLKNEGYTVEVHPKGTMPTYYATPEASKGVSPLEHLLEVTKTLSDPFADQSHPCEHAGCTYIVAFDDEPYCFTHSPDSGSSLSGYSFRGDLRKIPPTFHAPQEK